MKTFKVITPVVIYENVSLFVGNENVVGKISVRLNQKLDITLIDKNKSIIILSPEIAANSIFEFSELI